MLAFYCKYAYSLPHTGPTPDGSKQMATFTIRNRWTGEAIYTCNLSAEVAGKSYGLQLGFAVRSAVAFGSDLRGSNLRDSDLSGSDLRGSNLSDSNLSGSNLRGSDWIPRIPNIHSEVFAAASKPHALDMGSWHETDSCGTTHCRAGWVIALAGMPGRVLEGCYGTPAAAALIYQASDPTLEKVPNFFSGNAEALADMERLAKAEAAQVSA